MSNQILTDTNTSIVDCLNDHLLAYSKFPSNPVSVITDQEIWYHTLYGNTLFDTRMVFFVFRNVELVLKIRSLYSMTYSINCLYFKVWIVKQGCPSYDRFVLYNFELPHSSKLSDYDSIKRHMIGKVSEIHETVTGIIVSIFDSFNVSTIKPEFRRFVEV